MSEEKPIVSKEEAFDRLEIRIGKIVSTENCFPGTCYFSELFFMKMNLQVAVRLFLKLMEQNQKFGVY